MLEITTSVHRDLSAERANFIANHPSVRPWVGGAGPIDLTQAVADPSNYLLMGEHGGVFFQCLEPGLFESHTFFLEPGRGKSAVAVTKDALRWMFTRTPAVEIVTKVPEGNAGALGLVRAIHGQLQFTREHAWQAVNTTVSVGYYSLPIMVWTGKCEELALSGQFFHDRLEAAKASTPNAAPPHDEDLAHDLFVGCAVEMAFAGQISKAMNFYERWRKFSGYGPISVISTNPVVFDTGDALIALEDNDFRVLLCR